MLSKDQRINWDVKQCDPGEIMISASGGHESSAGGVSGVHQKMWLRMFCEMFTAELLLVASSSSDVSSGVVVTTGWAVCDQVSDTLSSWPLTTPCTLHQTHVNNNTCYHQSASQPEQCRPSVMRAGGVTPDMVTLLMVSSIHCQCLRSALVSSVKSAQHPRDQCPPLHSSLMQFLVWSDESWESWPDTNTPLQYQHQTHQQLAPTVFFYQKILCTFYEVNVD